MECNAYPDRLDLKDVHLRMARQRGVKIVISTDSHTTENLKFMKYGVETARRGWIAKKEVVNTLGYEEFIAALRAKPGAAKNSAPIAERRAAPAKKARKKSA
jgi:DNA polymerase (family 10)